MANKLYEESLIQNIADSLRLKSNKTDKYKVIDIGEALLNVPFYNIPEYHYEEAGRVINKILTLKQQCPNHIVFGTISDNHVNLSDENTIQSAKHATFALETVGKFAQCDFVANLGDNIAGTSIDDDTEYKNFIYMRNINKYAVSNIPYFNIVGNHCKSNTTSKIYDILGVHNVFTKSSDTAERGFGYRDFTDKKVRVICLNTCDYWNIQGGNGMSYEQKDFLMKALDLSNKSDYTSWTILMLSHIPIDFLGGDYNKSDDIKAILKAYSDGTTVNIAVNSSYASKQNESSKYSGTLSYNYSGKNAPKVIHIHGHIHTNKTRDKLIFIDDNTEIDMVRLATHSSVYEKYPYSERYTTSGDYSITSAEATKIAKVPNTVKDTSATFYFIDLTSQIVYSVGYGADVDRMLVYGDATMYSISYSLDSVNSSNSSLAIIEGGSYTTTLTAFDGYMLDVVKVTMGGVDITSSTYSNGVITVDNVMGDIVVTATAKDNYVPHWDISRRTAITDMYKSASATKEFARQNYYYGVAGSGLIDYRKITSCTLNGNDVTFTVSEKGYGIGLPYKLEANTSYKFTATSSITGRLRVVIYDSNGVYITNEYSSSGTNLAYNFTTDSDTSKWYMLLIDSYSAGTVTYSDITLSKQ